LYTQSLSSTSVTYSKHLLLVISDLEKVLSSFFKVWTLILELTFTNISAILSMNWDFALSLSSLFSLIESSLNNFKSDDSLFYYINLSLSSPISVCVPSSVLFPFENLKNFCSISNLSFSVNYNLLLRISISRYSLVRDLICLKFNRLFSNSFT